MTRLGLTMHSNEALTRNTELLAVCWSRGPDTDKKLHLNPWQGRLHDAPYVTPYSGQQQWQQYLVLQVYSIPHAGVPQKAWLAASSSAAGSHNPPARP